MLKFKKGFVLCLVVSTFLSFLNVSSFAASSTEIRVKAYVAIGDKLYNNKALFEP